MEIEDWEDNAISGPEKADKPQIPSSGAEIFYCKLFHAKIGGHVCVKRQIAVIKSGGREKADVRYTPCSLGRCHQGRLIMREEWAIVLVQLRKEKKNDR